MQLWEGQTLQEQVSHCGTLWASTRVSSLEVRTLWIMKADLLTRGRHIHLTLPSRVSFLLFFFHHSYFWSNVSLFPRFAAPHPVFIKCSFMALCCPHTSYVFLPYSSRSFAHPPPLMYDSILMRGDGLDHSLSKKPRRHPAKQHSCLFGKETRRSREAIAPNQFLHGGDPHEPAG